MEFLLSRQELGTEHTNSRKLEQHNCYILPGRKPFNNIRFGTPYPISGEYKIRFSNMHSENCFPRTELRTQTMLKGTPLF
jgi:hypothetical protein